MRLLLCTYDLAVLTYVAVPPVPASLAQASDCQDQLSPARQAIHRSQDRLSKFDAAIAARGAGRQHAPSCCPPQSRRPYRKLLIGWRKDMGPGANNTAEESIWRRAR